MSHRATACNDARLETLLQADESSAQFEVALQHVETCEPCRLRWRN